MIDCREYAGSYCSSGKVLLNADAEKNVIRQETGSTMSTYLHIKIGWSDCCEQNKKKKNVDRYGEHAGTCMMVMSVK